MGDSTVGSSTCSAPAIREPDEARSEGPLRRTLRRRHVDGAQRLVRLERRFDPERRIDGEVLEPREGGSPGALGVTGPHREPAAPLDDGQADAADGDDVGLPVAVRDERRVGRGRAIHRNGRAGLGPKVNGAIRAEVEGGGPGRQAGNVEGDRGRRVGSDRRSLPGSASEARRA